MYSSTIDSKRRIARCGYEGEICLVPAKCNAAINIIAAMTQECFEKISPQPGQNIREICNPVVRMRNKICANAFVARAGPQQKVTFPRPLLAYIGAEEGSKVYITKRDHFTVISPSPDVVETTSLEAKMEPISREELYYLIETLQ